MRYNGYPAMRISGDAAPGLSDNARSCVLRVTSASGRVALLTGDITASEESRLLRDQPGLHADLLLAGALQQPQHQVARTGAPLGLDDRVE